MGFETFRTKLSLYFESSPNLIHGEQYKPSTVEESTQNFCLYHSTQSNAAASWSLSLNGRKYLATDPKDHINGLLALTKIPIVPDYRPGKTVGEVYSDYVDAMLRNYDPSDEVGGTNNRLSFLFFAGIGIFENTLGLPSWAPNYAEDAQKGLTGFWIYANASHGMFTGKELVAMVKGSLLVVYGVNVGSVSKVELAPHEDTWFDGSMLAYFKDFVKRHPTYAGGVPPLQAILRAIKLDSFSEPNADLLHYAYNMLQFILAVDPLHMETHLEELGLGTGEEFNIKFPTSFFPEIQDPKTGWWQNFLKPPGLTDDYRTDLQSMVISDLTWLRKRWRFCETTSGYFGLAPLYTRPGDILCILDGCHTPVVIRQTEDQYEFVGCCFIVGLMTGQAKELMNALGSKIQRFEIR